MPTATTVKDTYTDTLAFHEHGIIFANKIEPIIEPKTGSQGMLRLSVTYTSQIHTRTYALSYTNKCALTHMLASKTLDNA